MLCSLEEIFSLLMALWISKLVPIAMGCAAAVPSASNFTEYRVLAISAEKPMFSAEVYSVMSRSRDFFCGILDYMK